MFATADSVTTARLVGTAPAGYSEDPALHAKVWEALHISAVFERAGEFDVIHNSFDFLPLTYSGLVDTPVVTTIHGFSSEQIVPVFEKYNGRGYYVAISDADRHERLDYVATIHHGIDLGEFELQRTPGDYLLFFGRIHPDKGTVEAIDVAERAGMPLVIAGIIQDRGYFEQLVEPRLDGERVSYVGPVGPDRRGDLLGGARALLHLVNFDEPFGFSVVEAMACGTPVIATATRLDGRDRPCTGRTASSSIPRMRPLPPSTLRVRSTGQPCAHRSKGASTSSGWSTTTSRSIGASSSSTATHGSHRGRPLSPRSPGEPFRLGVNYWPARTAMGWWSNFDPAEVAADFARIAACGLDSVRVFLTWEDFQPAPDRVDREMLDRLVAVADLAGGLGLALIPTLFTGHMSGVNWIPAWALGGSGGDHRFRVVSGGRVVAAGLRNWYTDAAVGDAQALLAAEAAAALAGHEAVWAWDLGNENSNCVIPPTRVGGARLARAPQLGDPRRRRDGARHRRVAHGRPRRGSPARAARSLRSVRSPLDARLPDLRSLGRRSDRRPTPPVPGPRDPLARRRP